MRAHDLRALGLLPALGLCSCVVASEGESATLVDPLTAEGALVGHGWIEADATRQPLTMIEAAARSGRAELAAGHYEAARELLTVALSYEPEAPVVAALRLDQIDALIGMRQFDSARGLLSSVQTDDEDAAIEQAVDARRMLIRERERAIGINACETHIDDEPRALTTHDDFSSAWNELRGDRPGAAEIPLPPYEDAARVELCRTCAVGEPALSQFELDEGTVWGLVLPQEEGAVSVLPELLFSTMAGCEDDTEISIQRHGDLLWVRAFTDTRESFDPSDWDLDESAGLGSMAASSGSQSSGYYAGSGYSGSGYSGSGYSGSGYSGSGYAGSGYAGSGYAGSGYAGSGYAGSGYAYYDCGGYDDYEYYCKTSHSIERDVFIDLSRGQVVLDVVRSGGPVSPMGTVELERGQVRVDACGVEQTLSLSWSAA